MKNWCYMCKEYHKLEKCVHYTALFNIKDMKRCPICGTKYPDSVTYCLKKHCPYCGKKTSQVDMLEEIIEFAERTDAEVEFTDDEEIANLGHVAGLLRFK